MNLISTLGGLALVALASPTLSADQFSLEKDVVARYCLGMIQEFNFPDETAVDCISETHAIEVDFSHRWADAIGQALHYALWTKEIAENPDSYARWHRQVPTARRAGIIFACHADRRLETCANHVVRPLRIAEEYRLPITIWDCNPATDATLDDCQRLEP
jgi:hypothetical protein